MKRSYIIAAITAIAAIGWVASGQLTNGEAADEPATDAGAVNAEEEVPAVRVARLTAEPMTQEIVLQGRTQSMRSVDLRAEIAGSVEEILIERGRPVKKDDVILRIAVEDREAALEQARALLAQRRIEYDAARSLNQKGFQSETRLAEALAQFNAARAAVTRAELDLRNTAVRAPFDGVLENRPVEIGDYTDKGEVVATVVDLDPIRVVGQVSERNISSIALGAVGHAQLLDGRTVEGTITFISATADPATRTFRVELSVPNSDGTIVDGMTSRITLPVGQTMAHHVSPAVLTLADDGSVGVKVVDAEDRIRFVPVQIVGDDATGVWLGGLPQEVTLVVVGQEFVTAGQKVAPAFIDQEKTS